MKKIIALFCIALLFLCSTCQPTQIKVDMITLDKAIIPVWYAIQTQDMAQAQRANLMLAHRWQQFEKKYHFINPTNEDWKESFRLIEDWLCDLSTSIERNDHSRVATQIDHAIYEMMDFRYRHQMIYYLDHLWDFQFSFDEFLTIVNDPMLHLQEWCAVEEQHNFLTYHWKKLKRQQPEFEYFYGDGLCLNRYYYFVHKIDHQIQGLEKTLESANTELIACELVPIQENLLEIFTLLGDFESTKTYYATTFN